MSLPTYFCDECESPLTGSELDGEGYYPAHVTDGDHFWCDLCWEERWDRIREAREEDEAQDEREQATLDREFLDGPEGVR